MSGVNRLYHAALGGCLAALLLVTPALAQQDVEEPSATVNEGQGVAGETPPPEEDSGESVERQEAPPADPLPPPPATENEISTEPACGPRCEAAQQREKDDLIAQQRMADSTRDVVVVTQWQLYVGGAGIVLLVFTLWLTVRATNAAVDANRIARETNERQLRAYVTVEAIQTNPANYPMFYQLQWKNTGQTPATDVLTYTNWESRVDALPDDFPYPMDSINDSAALGPGQSVYAWNIFIPGETVERVRRGILRLFVWGAAEYNDTFKDTPRRRTEFCYEIVFEGAAAGDGQIVMGNRLYGPHNGIDDGCHHQPA